MCDGQGEPRSSLGQRKGAGLKRGKAFDNVQMMLANEDRKRMRTETVIRSETGADAGAIALPARYEIRYRTHAQDLTQSG